MIKGSDQQTLMAYTVYFQKGPSYPPFQIGAHPTDTGPGLGPGLNDLVGFKVNKGAAQSVKDIIYDV